MTDFSSLTLIIASYGNRHNFVARTCRYWSNTNVNMIVVDGSPDKMPPKYREQLPTTTNYLHFPSVDYFTRLRTATDLIKTEYAIMHPDDDIMIQSVVAKCIDELNGDKALLACDGVYSWFSYYRDQLYSLKKMAVVKPLPILGNDAAERLQLSFMSVFLYGVWRTELLKICFRMFPEKVSSPAVFCLVFQWGLAYLGKWKTIKELMWMRSYEEEASSDRDGIRRSFYFHQWYEGESYRNEVDETISRMVQVITDKTKQDADTVRKNLVQVFDQNSKLSKDEFGEEIPQISIMTGLRIKVKNMVPRSLIKAYRQFKYMNTPPAGVLMEEQIEWLRENGVVVDDNNIHMVHTLLRNYYTGAA